jgi:hypothetical protein
VVGEADIVSESPVALLRRDRESLLVPGPRRLQLGEAMPTLFAAMILTVVAAASYQLGVRHARPGPMATSPKSAVLATTQPRGSQRTVTATAATAPTPSPSLAAVERDLGHVAFTAGRALLALRHYDRALRIDPKAVDAQLIANLIACYGLRQTQPEAATLIVRFHLDDARPQLEALRRRGRTRGTRAGARYTLEKLGPSYVARPTPRTTG